MYNQELEQLIEIAIKDGHLTEKEIRVLKNKAKKYGIDEDEFEMVVESRLANLLAETTQRQTPQSSKKEQSQKCPSCGEIISFLVGVCPTCGHTFDLSKTDVVLIEKLEKDCQGLSRIKNSGMPILIALNIIYIGIAILFVIMDIDDLGIAIFGIFFVGNASLGWIFPMLANQDDEETGKLSSSKLDNYVFNIRSKIKSTKLVYANNSLIMCRLMDLEEYVKENLAARKKRAKMIIGIGVIVAVVLPIIGVLMDL